MTNEQIWQAILGHLEVSLSRANFNTWLKNTHIIESTSENIVVLVPSTYHKDWISSKYHGEMLKALKRIAPEIRTIEYKVGNPAVKQQGPIFVNPNENQSSELSEEAQTVLSDSPANHLNPKYVFENFVIGKNNELAHAAAVAVAKNPGTQYNPLFIYGGVGLGKTHLMQAVANQILSSNPRAKTLYVTSEKFTNDYISAISNKRMGEFKKYYRTVDILLVDDIQFISGKEGTQEEFFHTFNELRDNGKQIIITADRLPKEIPSIEQRLVSRFEWGMIADIGAPDLETRLAILRNKVAKKGSGLSEEILNYIAENIQTNIRELEGALNRLLVFQDMENRSMDIEQAKQILASVINNKKKGLTPKKVILLVSEFYNVSSDDLFKQSRRQEYVKPRQIAMFLVRQELKASFPSIGELFGGRDHTTVMHAVEKIEKLITEKESIKQEVDLILDKLYTTTG